MKKSLVAAEKKFGKLALHRETVKALSPSRLMDVAGGAVDNPFTEPQFPSQCSCCITECCC